MKFSDVRCALCGRGPAEAIWFKRASPKGGPAVWVCGSGCGVPVTAQEALISAVTDGKKGDLEPKP